MNAGKIASVILLTLSLLGCANLDEVREYATESAKFSAYTELTTRFRDTYEREQPYLSGEPARQAQENDRRRKAAYNDLLKIHRGVALYMQTLAILAGEDTFSLSGEINSLAGGIKAYPDLGIDAKHVDALAGITKTVTKWISASRQQNAVRNMVREGHEPLQTTLDGMNSLIRYYRKTNENEHKTVLGFFEVEMLFLDAPEDKLLEALARAHLQNKVREYSQAQQKYDNAEQGIMRIAEGHRKLFEGIDKLSSAEIRSAISKFAKDIKSVRQNLQYVHE